MILTIIYFILILGVTVFIHELGHFLFAKKFGVYVYEFSIGMGPKLFKFNRKNDETDYCIRLFPIGGYVQMAGEEVEIDEKIPVDMRLQSKKWYQRFLIMVAGVMNNFILGILILFVVALFNGNPGDLRYIKDSNIESLNSGDKIVGINGHFVNNYNKFALEMAACDNESFIMTVSGDSGKRDIEIVPIDYGKSNLLYKKDYGFSVDGLNILESSIESLDVGDKIVAINDVNIDSHRKLLEQLYEIEKDSSLEHKFTMTVVSSDDVLKNIDIVYTDNSDDTLLGYSYGFSLDKKVEKGLLPSIKYAFSEFLSLIEQMIFTILYLFTGTISLKALSGPVGIFNAVGSASSVGFIPVLSLLALITINVGFINILPIPAFDGGHVLFLIIEKIKGSPVNQKVENIIHTVFLVLLMILMVYITLNDVLKIFG